MIDGVGGSDNGRRDNPNHPSSSDRDRTVSPRSAADEFGRAVSKIAVAQICECVGFESFQSSALETLSDIAVRYLRDLGRTAAFHTNLSGRTESNVFDVVRALEELGSLQGFSGASDAVRCVAGSGMVRELVDYVDSAKEEVPFAQPVQHFPVVKDKSTMVPSFIQMGETPTGKHIPEWLPAFPDPHTYVHTPMWNKKGADPRADKLEQARQRRKAERSLLSLQQRLLCNGNSTVPATSKVDSSNHGNDIEVKESNPFLASPLPPGVKDVSPVSLVDNHFSVMDTFAPAIEAMKDGICEVVYSEKTSLPEKRPAVQLKFGTGKKLLGESLKLSIQNRNNGRQTSWIGRDDERGDDKKRRAELILRQAMENPQELTQL